jgi:hypothetical protein
MNSSPERARTLDNVGGIDFPLVKLTTSHLTFKNRSLTRNMARGVIPLVFAAVQAESRRDAGKVRPFCPGDRQSGNNG